MQEENKTIELSERNATTVRDPTENVTSITNDLIKSVIEDLKTDGYAIIPSVVSRKESERLKKQWWTIMSDVTCGRMKKDGSLDKNFAISTHFPNEQHGIMTDAAMGQNGVSWAVRTNDNVIKVFETFYGTRSLITSYDRVNHQVPHLPNNARLVCTKADGSLDESLFAKKQVTWMHVDQKPYDENQWGFKGIQAFVDLIGTEGTNGKDSGCFVCSPGSHLFNLPNHLKDAQRRGLYNTKLISSILKTKGPNPYGFYKFTSDERRVLLDKYPYKRIVTLKDGSPIPPGSMIIWDSRLFHQGSKSVGSITKERLCVYVNMEPTPNPMPKTLITKRMRYFEENRSCSHSPTYTKVFGNPQTYGKCIKHPLKINENTIQKPALCKRIKELIGITKRDRKSKHNKPMKPYYRKLLK